MLTEDQSTKTTDKKPDTEALMAENQSTKTTDHKPQSLLEHETEWRNNEKGNQYGAQQGVENLNPSVAIKNATTQRLCSFVYTLFFIFLI